MNEQKMNAQVAGNMNSAQNPNCQPQAYLPPPTEMGRPADVYESYRRMAEERMEERKRMRAGAATGRNRLILVFLFLTSIVFADVLTGSPGGFGATLCFWFYEVILFGAYRDGVGEDREKAIFLAIPVLLISLSFSLFRTSAGYFIPYATMTVLLLIQVVVLSKSRVTEVFSPQMIPEVLTRTIGKPIENLDLCFAALRVSTEGKNRRKGFGLIVLGVAAAVPFVILLLSLFLSADAIFKQGYERFLETLRIDISFGRFIGDIIVGGMIAILLGSIFIYNTTPGRTETKMMNPVRLNPVIGMTFTIVLDVVIVVFAFVQIRYLFFSNSYHAVIEEIGYAEYARQGFFELSWAAGIVFAVTASVLGLCRREGKNPPSIRIAALLMCIGNIVIALSSARRMQLYIEAHGFSIKRLSTLFGILVILVLLFWLAAKCIAPKMKSIRMIGVSVIVLATLFSFFNIDRAVSSYNTAKYVSGELEPDMEYFYQLSYTAASDLVALYEDAQRRPDHYTEEAKRQMKTAILQKKMSFDFRPLLFYTIDDAAVDAAFARLPEGFFDPCG